MAPSPISTRSRRASRSAGWLIERLRRLRAGPPARAGARRKAHGSCSQPRQRSSGVAATSGWRVTPSTARSECGGSSAPVAQDLDRAEPQPLIRRRLAAQQLREPLLIADLEAAAAGRERRQQRLAGARRVPALAARAPVARAPPSPPPRSGRESRPRPDGPAAHSRLVAAATSRPALTARTTTAWPWAARRLGERSRCEASFRPRAGPLAATTP